MRAALPERALLLGRRALAASPTAVVLADGDRIEAGGVIDARGTRTLSHLDLGWQKFVGRELALSGPHDLDAPIIMDADVEQIDGYRFVYCLPFAADRMFVEDTYYADGADLDERRSAGLIADYAAAQGWAVDAVVHEEAGVLPVAMGGDFDAYWRSGGVRVAKAGMRAALFHPLTGYSLPDAVRTASLLARGDLFRRRGAARRHLWPGAADVAGARILQAAVATAVPCRIAGGTPQGVRALLSSRPQADRALLCRQFNDDGQGTNPVGQAPGTDRRRARRAGGATAMRRAIVVGAGFGGLALAIRLQSAGVDTTIVEARDKPGGRAYYWEKDGFTFDAGPTVITDPACLEELWALSGRRMADDVTLDPVSPFYRLNWPDGTNFDYTNDDEVLKREIAKLDPADIAGYDKFLDYAAGVYREGYEKLGHVAFLDFASMIKAAPALAKYQAWRSVYSIVSSYIRNEKLREALSFHTLLVGGNPMTTSAIYALIHKLERDGGVWFARGGTNKLIGGMVTHFERLGGVLRLSDPVETIETLGDRVTGVVTKSGWRAEADMVAANGDIVHTYRDLLSGSRSAQRTRTKLERKRFSPSLFVVHFGVQGTWPGIPHHMILFGPRYKGLLADIYEHGVLSEDFSLYLHHPTVTDPSMAPEGMSTFYALAPVPNLSKFPVDWDEIAPILEKRILDEVGRRLIPDIHDRIVTKFSYTPKDFGTDLSAHQGSAFSLEPVLTQSAWFRVHNRDDHIPNLYFVGAGTHPGAGIPGVVGSAKATAKLMLEQAR